LATLSFCWQHYFDQYLAMWWIGPFLLAMVAVATDVEECGGGAACPALGSSLLQRKINMEQNNMLTRQQLEHEKRRRDTLVESLVERRLMILASLVREGMSEPDAVSSMQSWAEGFNVDDVSVKDLSSDSSLHALIQEGLVPLHHLICHVRQVEAGCETEWKEYMNDALNILSEIRSSLLQLLVGKGRTTKEVPIIEKGRTDPKVLELLQEHFLRYLKVIVKSGEDPGSALQMSSEAMGRLKTMSPSSLLAYTQYSKAELAKKYFLSILHTACLPSTGSCADLLSTMVWTADEEAHGGTTLLQVAVRPAVQLIMRIFGLPEVPEETAVERAMATEAYLKESGFQSS